MASDRTEIVLITIRHSRKNFSLHKRKGVWYYSQKRVENQTGLESVVRIESTTFAVIERKGYSLLCQVL